MNNFVLCSISMRSALFNNRLEPPYETHTGAAPRLSHNLHPTTHNPPRGADLTFVRPLRPHRTYKHMTIRHLPLWPKNNQISGSLLNGGG